MVTATQTILDIFFSLQSDIDELYQFSEGDKYLIQPCQFFQTLTIPENDFQLIIPKGQKSNNVNVKVIDGKIEFNETIDLENSLNAQIKIPYNKVRIGSKKVIEEILGAMSAIESRLNTYLSKEKVNASKKYYLLFYNQSLEPPMVGGNYLMARLVSPQMGLPFDFIFKDEIPNCLITLKITYKLISRINAQPRPAQLP